jgi:hypothetical protein
MSNTMDIVNSAVRPIVHFSVRSCEFMLGMNIPANVVGMCINGALPNNDSAVMAADGRINVSA